MSNKNTQTKTSSQMPKQRFRGLKLIGTELNATIFMAVLIGVIMAALSLISVFVQKEYDVPPAIGDPNYDTAVTAIQSATFGSVAQALSSVAIYSIINRIRLVVRDKSTLDRNRTMFLTNKKEVVVFSKVIVDLFSFMIPVLLVLAIGLPIISSKGGLFIDDFAIRMVGFIFALMFTYLISTFVMRWITSLEVSKLKMWIILGTWTLFTLLWMVGGGIAFGILAGQTEGANKVHTSSAQSVIDFFANNQIWLSIIPVVNMVTPFMSLYSLMDAWTVAPLVGEALIALIILWRPVSGILKTYLTT